MLYYFIFVTSQPSSETTLRETQTYKQGFSCQDPNMKVDYYNKKLSLLFFRV